MEVRTNTSSNRVGYMWIVHLESLHCAPGMDLHHEFWVACTGFTESHRTGQRGVCAPTTEPDRSYVLGWKMGKSGTVWYKDWDEIPTLMPMQLDKRNVSRTTAWKLKRQRKSCMLAWFLKSEGRLGHQDKGLHSGTIPEHLTSLLDSRCSGHACK